jgi:hypothetical protein
MENNTPEQKTDNELIAEFMKNHAINSPHLRTTKELENTYDYSWDWLMPVVEKIHEIIRQQGNGKWTKEESSVKSIYSVQLNMGIDRIYKMTVDFIKWYNQQSNG